MTIKQEILDLIDSLPIDRFVKDDGAGAFYVDMENMDATDYVDHCVDFNQAMIKASILKEKIINIDPVILQREWPEG